MIRLQAPYPLIQTTTALPNPQFNDTQNAVQSLSISRAIDGTRYSYIKKPGLTKLSYSFVLSRQKSEELKAFIASYYRAKILLTNHKGEQWTGWLTANPFDFVSKGSQQDTITLEFEGQLL